MVVSEAHEVLGEGFKPVKARMIAVGLITKESHVFPARPTRRDGASDSSNCHVRFKVLFSEAGGLSRQEPQRHEATAATLFDLASLTKPLATALLALRAHDQGLVDLEGPLEEATDNSQCSTFCVTRPVSPLGAALRERPIPRARPAIGFCASARWRRLETRPFIPTSATFSSDSCWKRICKETRCARQGAVLEPLGIGPEEACFQPLRPREEIAATELDGAHEAEMARRNGAEPLAVPKGGLWGVVHDGNARFLGGVAGHAGLFATAASAAVWRKHSSAVSGSCRQALWRLLEAGAVRHGRGPHGRLETCCPRRDGPPGGRFRKKRSATKASPAPVSGWSLPAKGFIFYLRTGSIPAIRGRISVLSGRHFSLWPGRLRSLVDDVLPLH